MTIDIPEAPTLKDLYTLLATTAQQLANHVAETAAYRADLARITSRHTIDIDLNGRRITALTEDVGRLKVELEGIRAWQTSHQFTCPYADLPSRAVVRAQLHHLLTRHFDMDELGQMAFELGEDPAEIGGDTPSVLAQALVLHFEKRGRMGELLKLCRRYRPGIAWPPAYT